MKELISKLVKMARWANDNARADRKFGSSHMYYRGIRRGYMSAAREAKRAMLSPYLTPKSESQLN